MFPPRKSQYFLATRTFAPTIRFQRVDGVISRGIRTVASIEPHTFINIYPHLNPSGPGSLASSLLDPFRPLSGLLGLLTVFSVPLLSSISSCVLESAVYLSLQIFYTFRTRICIHNGRGRVHLRWSLLSISTNRSYFSWPFTVFLVLVASLNGSCGFVARWLLVNADFLVLLFSLFARAG